MKRRTESNVRSQLHTLEGISAALLIVLALSYSVQAVAITSTSSTTSSEEIEAQYDQMATDLLTQAKQNGNLKDAILNWNPVQRRFTGSTGTIYYQGTTPPGEFGRTLEMVLGGNDLTYNIYLRYKSGQSVFEVPFVYNGKPSVNSVTKSEVVVLNENDRLANGRLIKNSNYPMDNMPNRGVYNIVEVRLTVWRR